MAATDYVVEILGGAGVLRDPIARESVDIRTRIQHGLPYKSLESVSERLRLSVPETADVLRMPPRTLARRRQARKLDPEQSDRLYRLARIAAHAFSVFGTDDKVATWLRRPNRALNGEPPIHLLDTDIGAQLVDDVLGRLEHGVVG